MQQSFTTSQITFLRKATDLASRLVGTRSDQDKAEIANYVLMAFESKFTDIDDLAHRASQHFLLWQSSQARPSRKPEPVHHP